MNCLQKTNVVGETNAKKSGPTNKSYHMQRYFCSDRFDIVPFLTHLSMSWLSTLFCCEAAVHALDYSLKNMDIKSMMKIVWTELNYYFSVGTLMNAWFKCFSSLARSDMIDCYMCVWRKFLK